MSDDDLVAGRYRLGRSLGSGGMGRVWHARDEVLRRSVAIKEVLLPESLAEDEATELRMRTLREARAAARLSHPNVVRIYDVIYADGRPWIVMEYVPSKSLAAVISENGPISPSAAAKVGIAVLDALCAAHAAGVLHRDVKPGNVLLGANGRVVLTDFGLAVYDDLGMQLTQSGIIHGSPQFIAPERAADGTSTQESDMWSLGATLYAAVEGRSPYSRPSSYATLLALATLPPDQPHKAGPIKPVLVGLLRRSPKSRMKPAEVRSRLQRVVAAAADGGRSKPNRGRKQAEAEPPRNDRAPQGSPGSPGAPGSPGSLANQGPEPVGAAPAPAAAPGAQATAAEAAEALRSGTPVTGGQQPDRSPVKLPIMPDWQQAATAAGGGDAGGGSGAHGTATGERRTVTPLPRRNPGAFGGTNRPPSAAPSGPQSPQGTAGPQGPAGPAGPGQVGPGRVGPGQAGPAGPAGRRPPGPGIDDSGVGLIDLVAGLEENDITPLLPYSGHGGRRYRWRFPRAGHALLILLVAVVIGATAVFVATRGRGAHGSTSGQTVQPPSDTPSGSTLASSGPATGGRPPALTFPCPATPPLAPLGPVPQGPLTMRGHAVANRYTWFTSPDALSIAVPVGWRMATTGNVTCFYDPTSAQVLGVTSIVTTARDPVAVLRSTRAALFSMAGSPPGYTLRELAADAYTTHSAHWEYTYQSDAETEMHVYTQLMMSSKGHALLFSFEDTDFDWNNSLATRSQIMATFLTNE